MCWNTITIEGGLVVETEFVYQNPYSSGGLIFEVIHRVSRLSRAHSASFVQLDEGVNVCKNCM